MTPRHALITGGSRGIGLAIARLLAHKNHRCTLIALNPARLKTAHDQISSIDGGASATRHDFIAGNVSSPKFWSSEQIGQHLNGAFRNAGMGEGLNRVDVLVNCAGVSQERLLQRSSQEDVQKIVDINLTGMMLGVQYLLKSKQLRAPSQEERKSEGYQSPVIVNVASLLGVKGGRGAAAYAASKAGVIGFTRAMATELGPQGIRVNAIVPGYVDTDMTEGLSSNESLTKQIPLGRFGTANEVADAALFLIQNQYANNCVLNLDGGLSAT